MKHTSSNFEDLVWKYLDQDISDSEFAELQQQLESDLLLRKQYQHMVEVHQSLQNHAQNQESGATEITPLFPQQSTESTPSSKQNIWAWVSAVAAILCVGLFVYAILSNEPTLEVEYIAVRDADIRGAGIVVGDRADTRMTHLMSGAVALLFPSKTETVIEGPAYYQVQSNGSVMVSSGTITVDHQGDPGTFKVITPLGELVDMGTKFGVKIGNGVTDSMVMTEVYEGEVIYKNSLQDPLSITEGQGYAFLGNNNSRDVVTKINGEGVKVSGTFDLSNQSMGLKRTDNLALGKPVTASSYYNAPKNGEVFRPEALTDNQLADSGSPWDWSFWLTSNGDSGSATIDLLDVYTISRIELQNTRNRQYSDRGFKDFIIEVSTDDLNYKKVTEGTLKRIKWHDAKYFEFETFEFASTPARYIRIVGITNYTPDDGRHDGGGGLNEVRVFE